MWWSLSFAGRERYPVGQRGGENRTHLLPTFFTIGYCGAWVVTYGLVSESERALTNLVFLICSNLTTHGVTPLTWKRSATQEGEQILPGHIWSKCLCSARHRDLFGEHGSGTGTHDISSPSMLFFTHRSHGSCEIGSRMKAASFGVRPFSISGL